MANVSDFLRTGNREGPCSVHPASKWRPLQPLAVYCVTKMTGLSTPQAPTARPPPGLHSRQGLPCAGPLAKKGWCGRNLLFCLGRGSCRQEATGRNGASPCSWPTLQDSFSGAVEQWSGLGTGRGQGTSVLHRSLQLVIRACRHPCFRPLALPAAIRNQLISTVLWSMPGGSNALLGQRYPLEPGASSASLQRRAGRTFCRFFTGARSPPC